MDRWRPRGGGVGGRIRKIFGSGLLRWTLRRAAGGGEVWDQRIVCRQGEAASRPRWPADGGRQRSWTPHKLADHSAAIKGWIGAQPVSTPDGLRAWVRSENKVSVSVATM
jgi:hypothetical protein